MFQVRDSGAANLTFAEGYVSLISCAWNGHIALIFRVQISDEFFN